MVGAGATQEVLTICQTEEMLILSRRGLVPQLYGVLKRHPDKG